MSKLRGATGRKISVKFFINGRQICSSRSRTEEKTLELIKKIRANNLSIDIRNRLQKEILIYAEVGNVTRICEVHYYTENFNIKEWLRTRTFRVPYQTWNRSRSVRNGIQVLEPVCPQAIPQL